MVAFPGLNAAAAVDGGDGDGDGDGDGAAVILDAEYREVTEMTIVSLGLEACAQHMAKSRAISHYLQPH